MAERDESSQDGVGGFDAVQEVAAAVTASGGATDDTARTPGDECTVGAAIEELDAVLHTMLDAVIVASTVRDDSGKIIDFCVDYINPVAEGIYGRPADEIVGRRLSEIGMVRPTRDLAAAWTRLVESGEPVEFEGLVVQTVGARGPEERIANMRAARLRDGYVAVWRDVTARHVDAQTLAATSAQFAAAFDHAPLGMALLNAEGLIVRANEALATIAAVDVGDLPGMPLDGFVDERDRTATRTQLAALLSGERSEYRAEIRLRTSESNRRWVSVSAALAQSSAGVFIVVHVEDIDERKSFEGRLQYLADHDALTGLFNRRRFQEELAHQLAVDARYVRSSALMLVDLDNFKYINDTLGHQVGDRLIQEISRSLRKRLRASDVVGRLGGDEFAVLLPGVAERAALGTARALLDAVRASQVEHSGHLVRSTASIGIVEIDGGDALEPDDALARADLAMYAAKDAGRNTSALYDPTGRQAADSHARFRWLDRVRVALEADLFRMHAQPILDVASGRVVGCELLLRMTDGARLIGAGEFLPIAERHGLANAIDRWVIPRAIDLAGNADAPPDFRWEINLSADSLSDPDIPDVIASELDRAGASPGSLVFEITETAAIANIEQAQAFASRINEIGCHFALDDFGAGYGSFYYLKHLPFEYLKIDGEFVRQLATSDTDRVIVRAIVSAARELGKRTVAEYVSDKETLDLLRAMGVDYAQGDFVGMLAGGMTLR